MSEPVHIDGSRGEGGGQILRTSLALAALLRQPVKIVNIRANRSQPGLKTQHLAGVLALAGITGAEVKGARIHSTRLEFLPRTIAAGRYRFEISTAGAACLLFGAILPALLFAGQTSEVTITGGTHVPYSPPYHYLARVFLPFLRKLGAVIDLELLSWGFYPKGGGAIRARVSACSRLSGLKAAERGRLKNLRFSAWSGGGLPDHITRREIAYGEKNLAEYDEGIRTSALVCEASSPGNFVFLEAQYEHCLAGFSGLGKRGKPAEQVAEEVCSGFRKFHAGPATVDSRLADQVILYLAMAHGDSMFITEKVTSHLLTNIEIIGKFLPAGFEVDALSGRVRVKGAGLNSALKN